MGLSMEFYAGPPQEIGRAFTDYEFDVLRDGSLAHAYADLSLHISPDHLDLLSEVVAQTIARPPVLLLNALEQHIGGTDGGSSADVVSNEWVVAVAAVPDQAIAAVTRSWMAAVADDVGDPDAASYTEDAERAVTALVALCRAAIQQKTRVVYAWYL